MWSRGCRAAVLRVRRVRQDVFAQGQLGSTCLGEAPAWEPERQKVRIGGEIQERASPHPSSSSSSSSSSNPLRVCDFFFYVNAFLACIVVYSFLHCCFYFF